MLGNLFVSYAGCVVSSRTAPATKVSLVEANLPSKLALPPGLLWNLGSTFIEGAISVMGQ